MYLSSVPCGIYDHPEVDRIWVMNKEYIVVHSKVMFNRLQDGCNHKGM